MESSSTASDKPETVEHFPTSVTSCEDDAKQRPSAIPLIVVQDGTRPVSLSKKLSSRVQKSKIGKPDNDINQTNITSSGSESIGVITTDIPTGTFDDPFSSQMQFSNRGSVLLGPTEAKAFARTLQKSSSVRGSSNTSSILQQGGGIRVDGLRCVSTDERRLSRRVRSFYEPGKDIAEEPAGLEHSSSISDNVTSEEIDEVPELAGTLAPRHAQSDDRLRESRSASALSMRSELQKEPNEAAGGAEDWTDVDSKDVDRWGFIKPRSLSSKRSSVVSTSATGSPVPQQRSRTRGALSVVNETRPGVQDSLSLRKKTRLSLNAAGKPLKSSPSGLSSQTKRSTTSRIIPFRGANDRPRWLMDAPDMLVPPPNLGDESSDPYHDPTREARRADKWQKMARQIPNSPSSRGAGTKYVFNVSDPKLISRVWKGIPDRWRSEAWYAFLTSSAAKHSLSKQPDPPDVDLEAFFHNCQDDDCADDVQIDMDVPRTIGNHLQFRKRYRGGQRFLFRVLRALSLYFPETGYVQGMASVVATLLVYYEESRAFVMAVRLWQLRGVRKLYSEGFEGLMAALQELEERWIRRTEVIKQLESLGISTSAWGPKWYLTLFNYVLPFHTMLRVWDVFMLLGDTPPTICAATSNVDNDGANFDVLHAAAAAMLSALRDMIVDADFENAMKALTSSVMVGKDDKMMSIARKLWEERKEKRRDGTLTT